MRKIIALNSGTTVEELRTTIALINLRLALNEYDSLVEEAEIVGVDLSVSLGDIERDLRATQINNALLTARLVEIRETENYSPNKFKKDNNGERFR